MRERVTLVGGTLNIESQPGSGTTVFVRIPVQNSTMPTVEVAEPQNV